MAKQIKRFEDLEIWQSAVQIAVDIYHLTENGKLKTDFGMRDQIRRAACSISNNIAEGFEYNNNREFIRFLKFSKGSSGELRNQLYILKEAGYVSPENHKDISERSVNLSKKISGFIKYLKDFEGSKKMVQS